MEVAMVDALKMEVDANYDFFARRLGGLLDEHANQYALLKSKAIIAFAFADNFTGANAFKKIFFTIQYQ